MTTPTSRNNQPNSSDAIPHNNEDFTVVAQLIEQAAPIPRDQFKEELRMRLLNGSPLNQSPTGINPFQFKGLSTVASLAVIILVSAAVVYAIGTFVQRAIQLDGGLGIEQGQELDIAQTVNGYILTAEWVYADQNRISIGLSLRADATQNMVGNISPTSQFRLTDTQGTHYPFLTAAGTGMEQNEAGIVYSFAIPQKVSLESEISVNLLVDLEVMDPEYKPIAVGTFQYLIQAQVSPVKLKQTLNVPQTVTASGIDITLASVQVTSSMTRLEVCFTVEDPEFSEWIPVMQFQIGNRNLHDGSVRIDGSPRPSANCQYVNYYVDLIDAEGPWTLKVIQVIGTKMLTFEEPPTYPIPPDMYEKRIDGLWVFNLN